MLQETPSLEFFAVCYGLPCRPVSAVSAVTYCRNYFEAAITPQTFSISVERRTKRSPPASRTTMTQAHKTSAMYINDVMHYWLDKLAAACEQAQVTTASLGIIHKDQIVSVSHGRPLLQDDTAGTRNSALCVAKLFTSTLVSLLVLQGKLKFEDQISDLLPVLSGIAQNTGVLTGVKVSHLLSHTHGLDTIGLDAAPVTDDGFIDHEQVFALLGGSTRMFAPGKFYSYGVEGYILLGIIIEHITQKTYRQALHKEILTRLEHDIYQPTLVNNIAPLPAICPSSGKGLHLPHTTLTSFVSCFLNPGKNVLKLSPPLMAEIFRKRTTLPGWSPTISGCCYGWKTFGDNWYGQNGMDGHNLMYVRVNRITKTALCLVAQSNKRHPGALPSLLLQQKYPELAANPAKSPGVLTDATTDNCKAIAGTYGNRVTTFRIIYSDERLLLEIVTTYQGNEISSHHCYLYPAEQNIFFLSKPWQYITFLQLVKGDGAMRYLWDHSQLWSETCTEVVA
jgi:CubicO group peptidase (beta-lactamase class C family)